jgi:hypothetical protein
VVEPGGVSVSWSCPRCGRTFARKDQFHSHDTMRIDDHFAGRAENLRMAFDQLIGSLPTDVQVEALRTVIILSSGTTFAFITVQSKRLLVGLFLDRHHDSPRPMKVDVISARKVEITVEVRGPDDVDDELRLWVRRAYELHAGTSRSDGGAPSGLG